MHKRRQPRGHYNTILIVCLIAVLVIGIGATAYTVDARLGHIFFQIVGGGVAILMVVWLIALQGHHDNRRRREHDLEQQQRPARQQAAAQTPTEFNDRLAHFLHRPPDQTTEPESRPRSKMPFWCRVELLTRFGPKPTERIRELLHRIRQAVHGRNNGHG